MITLTAIVLSLSLLMGVWKWKFAKNK